MFVLMIVLILYFINIAITFMKRLNMLTFFVIFTPLPTYHRQEDLVLTSY